MFFSTHFDTNRLSYIVFRSANDKYTTCSYGILLKLRASFDCRKTILRMSHGFLAIGKTVTELTFERLAIERF